VKTWTAKDLRDIWDLGEAFAIGDKDALARFGSLHQALVLAGALHEAEAVRGLFNDALKAAIARRVGP